MKYVITGANGYIGREVVKSVLDSGHFVNFVVREGSASEKLHEALVAYDENNFAFHTYDGGSNSLLAATENIDRVIHLAALFKTGHDSVTAEELVLSNIKFSIDLFTATLANAPDAHVVAASSWSAYGSSGEYAPQNLYSATKKVVEDLAVTLPLAVTFLRFSDTYGAGDWRRKIVNIFRDAILRGEDFTFGSPGEQEIYLLHIEDIIGAIDHAFALEESGVHGYDLFYPENKITLREVASKLVEKAGAGGYSFPNTGAPNALPPQVDIMPDFEISKPASKYITEVIG